jgi:hypothetical protein
MNLPPIIFTILGIALITYALFVRGINRRGRKTLLRTLEVLDEPHRRQLLAKFTPKVQTELRSMLYERNKS